MYIYMSYYDVYKVYSTYIYMIKDVVALGNCGRSIFPRVKRKTKKKCRENERKKE